jgi:hypothetical protein
MPPLIYAFKLLTIAGIIFTDNYVKKIRFTLRNYGVEFCTIIIGIPV